MNPNIKEVRLEKVPDQYYIKSEDKGLIIEHFGKNDYGKYKTFSWSDDKDKWAVFNKNICKLSLTNNLNFNLNLSECNINNDIILFKSNKNHQKINDNQDNEKWIINNNKILNYDQKCYIVNDNNKLKLFCKDNCDDYLEKLKKCIL